MEEHKMDTYTSGYTIKSTRSISKLDIINICTQLNNQFGPGYEFVPEAITEGGILWKHFPEKSEKMYKTMRLGMYYDWAKVDPCDNVEYWIKNPGDLCKSDIKFTTFLKSFFNAPSWTITELKIFEKCLSENGFKVFGNYPKKKNLKYNTTL